MCEREGENGGRTVRMGERMGGREGGKVGGGGEEGRETSIEWLHRIHT